jgi:L-serine deaminase
MSEPTTNINDWLCAYAMAVNEENAAITKSPPH